jgi:hypothetical protein
MSETGIWPAFDSNDLAQGIAWVLKNEARRGNCHFRHGRKWRGILHWRKLRDATWNCIGISARPLRDSRLKLLRRGKIAMVERECMNSGKESIAISVITPSYNQSRYLAEPLRVCLGQEGEIYTASRDILSRMDLFIFFGAALVYSDLLAGMIFI